MCVKALSFNECSLEILSKVGEYDEVVGTDYYFCSVTGQVQVNWCSSCIMLLYKEKKISRDVKTIWLISCLVQLKRFEVGH